MMPIPALRNAFTAMLLAALVACGGGGGGSSTPLPNAPPTTPTPDPTPSPTPVPDPPPPEPPPPSEEALLESASRLVSRTTFGMNYAGIETVKETGEDAWLEQQFSLPIGLHEPIVTDLLQRQAAGEFAELEEEFQNIEFAFRRMAWWQQAVYAEDMLRQRVAFALSEIFVVSDKSDMLTVYPYALSNYQDMLLTHAFGNVRDLLRAITLHPAMGIYLSHINNAKADPAKNTFPDENYAREVMQLFSIGLFELKPDGSEKLDAQGDPIPTYDNDDIREFAKIFTGLSFGGPGAFFGRRLPAFRQPMTMFDAFHEPGEKYLLRGQIVPAGQTGMEDIEAAIDNLFNHPNMGPFIGKLLIQRLVTSNPSAAYVSRVSAAFAGEQGGVRGDMKAVLRAILFDPEAQAAPGSIEHFGKLREPLVRTLATLKALNVSSPDGFYANAGYFLENLLNQHPLSAFSVFNFFLPGYQPVGEIADAGLVAPEFQITNSSSIVSVSNLADILLFRGLVNDIDAPPFQRASINLDEYAALVENPEQLLDRLDLVMTYGTLSEQTRQNILDVLEQVDDLEFRLITAIYLVYVSPDYAVEI
jgi:uncharacterized protein (DUF1800 family)